MATVGTKGLTASDALLTVLRRKNLTAYAANALCVSEHGKTLRLVDPARALRKLAARGLVAPHATKAGEVFDESGQRVWAITSAGRDYIKNRLTKRSK